MVEFNRPEIKENAKEVFRAKYWPMVGFTAIYVAICSAVGGIGAIPVLGALAAPAASILFMGPLAVSMSWLYYRVYNGEDVVIGDMFMVFKNKETWVKAFVTMLLVSVFTALWSLLFVIPGIIKGISYSMAPFLIIEDPTLTPKQAIAKSQEMTMGYKGAIFALELSFIGWIILAVITAGVVGVFWAFPYYYIALSGIYARLRENGIPATVAYAAPAKEAQTAEAEVVSEETTEE